jgi:predicted RNA-binding Zn ribbon-like protein
MEFTFVSGNLGLDLVGTVGKRRSQRVDRLATPDDLARWTVDAQLLDDRPAVTADDFAETLAVREAIYRLATAARTSAPYDPADLDTLNRAAEPPPPTVRLTTDGVIRTGPFASALSAAARAAIDLLAGPQKPHIRECEAETCTRLFVDTSHRHTRRWCDMRLCGNRAKAAAFRARHS